MPLRPHKLALGGIYMFREYQILLGGECIGQARVRKEGLYSQIDAQCHLSGQVKFHLLADTGAGAVDLGLLVPKDGCFVCRTKQPTKRFSQGIIGFSVKPTHADMTETFVPLYPEKPFAYLDRLENAYLTLKNGQLGVTIKDF